MFVMLTANTLPCVSDELAYSDFLWTILKSESDFSQLCWPSLLVAYVGSCSGYWGCTRPVILLYAWRCCEYIM